MQMLGRLREMCGLFATDDGDVTQQKWWKPVVQCCPVDYACIPRPDYSPSLFYQTELLAANRLDQESWLNFDVIVFLLFEDVLSESVR